MFEEAKLSEHRVEQKRTQGNTNLGVLEREKKEREREKSAFSI